MLALSFAFSQSTKLIEQLKQAEGVEIKGFIKDDNFKEVVVLSVRQPLDHFNLEKGSFNQKVIISHRGFENVTVMVTEGYQIFEYE